MQVMDFIRKLIGSTVVASIFTGCALTDGGQGEVAHSDDMYAVVIGLDNSNFAGECPGAVYDAKRIYSLLCNYTTNVVLLTDKDATYSSVRNAMTKAVESGNHTVIFYSGHGGNYAFPDTVEEEDGMDEYLCLYDRYMRDDDVWSVISKSNGKVHLIFDCCHSATMFRNSKPFTVSRHNTLSSSREARGWSMLCWSGCPDDTYSYGSSSGGKMTNTILKYYNAGLTYDQLWDKVSSDAELKKYELVQRTEYGDGFKGFKVFK